MRKILTALVFIITFSGCAYFNTFYLAKKNFNEAEKLRIENKGVITGVVKNRYKDAIKWSSGILENYKDSKYVDDSLYIIGMSYYYQNDYLKARTKFDELLRAFPESELAQTALYFKGKSLVELDSENEALEIFLDIIDSDDPAVRGLAGIAITEISLNNENWDELLSASQKVIDLEPNEEELVRAIYYKSKALFELERYEECSAELLEIADIKTESELKFNINTLFALSEAKLEKYDVALSYLENMQSKGEFSDFAPRIRLQIGYIYEFQNDEETAMDTYRKLAGDFPDSLAAKEAWYNVGNILLKDLSNAKEAKDAFDMVKEGNARTNASWFVEAGIKSVQIDSMLARIEKIEEIEKYFEDMDSDESGRTDSADETEISTDSALENASADSVESVDRSGGAAALVIQDAEKKGNETFNYPESIGRARFSLAELYNFSFERPDSAIAQYNMIISEAPGTEYAVKSDYFLQMYDLQNSGEYAEESEEELMMKMIEKYPESEFSQELKVFLGLIENPPEVKAFIDAEMEYMAGKTPDVYIPLYQAVIDEYPKTESAYQARFFIAFAYEHYVGDMDTALEKYEALSEEPINPNSEVYVNLAAEKLKMVEQNDRLLRQIKDSIAYYELKIEDIDSGKRRDEIADSGFGDSGTFISDVGGTEYSGTKKIRARNARIRSRYYKD